MKKLLIILGVLGTSFSAALVRFSDAPSLVLVFYRMALAVALLLPWNLWKNREELCSVGRREGLLCLLSGVFLGLHFTCYFASLRCTSIASSVVLVDTEVFFVAFVLVTIFHERIGRLGWLGILVTFAGSVVIALADAGNGSSLKGDFFALTGAACMAVYTLSGKVCRRTLSTAIYTLLVYGVAAATVLIILLLSGKSAFGYGPRNLLCAAGMTVFCTLLGHSVFSWGLKYESAAFISTVMLLEPVFATVTGIPLFRELPSPIVVLGGAVVIGGICIYTLLGEKAGEKR